MREIKFRAWDKEQEKMFKPVYLLLSKGSSLPIVFKNGETIRGSGRLHGYNVELMQYTGLKDKNDIEIYEGDIATTPYLSRLTKGTVAYVGSSFVYVTEEGDTITMIYINQLPEFEVIGNIYENPELMEK